MSKINKTPIETRLAIERRSAAMLPDRPTQAGFKPWDIRNALFTAIIADKGACLMGEIDRIVDEANAAIDALKEKIPTAGTITIPVEEWSDAGPHEALVRLGNNPFSKGCVVLLAPEDKATKEVAGAARMSVFPDNALDSENSYGDFVMVLRAESGIKPTIPLNFRFVVLKTDTEDKAIATMVGVDAYGEGGAGNGVDEEAVKELIGKEVPEWARAKQKPTYTADEVKARPATWMPTAAEVGARPITWMPTAANVGADPVGTVTTHNEDSVAHTDIRVDITTLRTMLNTMIGTDTGKSMRAVAALVVAEIVGDASDSFDTLEEIAAWIEAHPNDVAAMVKRITDLETEMGGKVSKTDIINTLDSTALDKPLSAAMGAKLNTLLAEMSDELDGKTTAEQVAAQIKAALTTYITREDADKTYAKPDDIPLKTSQLTNDSGFITETEADEKYATPDMIPSSGTSETPYILLPPSITVAAGVEHLIYKDCLVFTQGSLDNWDVRAAIIKSQSTDPALAIYNDEDHLSIKATDDNVGISYTLNIRVLDRLETKRAEASATVTVVGGSVSGKTAMVIGDSNTASRNGLYTAEIQHNLAGGGVTFVGTQVGAGSSNGIGDVRHEGYNGAAASNSGKGFTEQYVVGTTPNPFYDSDTEEFDFSYYMESQGYSSVDAVCINLGSNMLGTDYTLTTIIPYNEMIDSIKEYDPNIQVIIGLSIPVANQETYRDSSYTANQMHIRWKNMIKNLISNFGGREAEGIYLATLCHCIDRAHDFPAVEVSPCDRGRLIHYEDGSKADETVTVLRQVDKMHPHRVGLYKMADALWPSLLRGLQAVTSGTEETTYTVTNNLTNVTSSNSATSVKAGGSYAATLTADSGYTLGEVTVTMGGSAVAVSGGEISIASVTGNIVITATATANEPATTNLLDFSVKTTTPVTTATPENELAVGYKISASNLSADDQAITTNTFAIAYGQKIKVENIKVINSGYTNYFRWWFFNADGSRAYGSYVNFTSGEGTANSSKDGATIDVDNNCAIVDTSYLSDTFKNITYARFACVPSGDYTEIVATII